MRQIWVLKINSDMGRLGVTPYPRRRVLESLAGRDVAHPFAQIACDKELLALSNTSDRLPPLLCFQLREQPLDLSQHLAKPRRERVLFLLSRSKV